MIDEQLLRWSFGVFYPIKHPLLPYIEVVGGDVEDEADSPDRETGEDQAAELNIPFLKIRTLGASKPDHPDTGQFPLQSVADPPEFRCS